MPVVRFGLGAIREFDTVQDAFFGILRINTISEACFLARIITRRTVAGN